MKARLILAAASLALTGVACGGGTTDPAVTPEREAAVRDLMAHCSGVARQVHADQGSDFVEYLLEKPDEAATIAMDDYDLPSWADAKGSHGVCKLAMVTAVKP